MEIIQNPLQEDFQQEKPLYTEPAFKSKSICIRRPGRPHLWHKPYVHLVYNDIDPETKDKIEALIPLKKSHLNCFIQDGLATMDLQFEFTNERTEEPVEVTLEFPCDKKTLISKMMAQIDDKVVNGKVEKKERAEQKYDDAIASGNTATLMEQKKNDNGFTLQLGNLYPGKTAQINVQLSKFLEIEGGSFAFRLPQAYFPDYSVIEKQKLGVAPKYTFSYNLEVKSFRPITYMSAPSQSKTEVKVEQKHVIVSSLENAKAPKRDQMLYFKTSDMGLPSLKVQFSEKYPDKVALLASFVPTFEQKEPQESMELFENEVPEQQVLNPDEKFCYIFIVDRSGSMSGSRMEITKEALKLFLKSLPPGSSFQIVSFGTTLSLLKENIIPYDDKNLKWAEEQVKNFSANFGGTNILNPLQYSTDKINSKGFTKRIFLLTDGQVRDRDAIIQYAQQKSHIVKVHTFGIGDGCDRTLVKETALAGRGSASFAGDGTADLRGLVIKALKNASQPSLKDCNLYWGNLAFERLGELFQDELITSARIISLQEFENLQLKFTSAEEPVHKTNIEVNFASGDFEAMPEGDILFKHAANLMIKNNEQMPTSDQTDMALKYQILCEHTAMVAVIKQKEKTTGELKEYKIPFGSKITAPDMPQPQVNLSKMYKKQRAPMKMSMGMPRGGALINKAKPAMNTRSRAAAPGMMKESLSRAMPQQQMKMASSLSLSASIDSIERTSMTKKKKSKAKRSEKKSEKMMEMEEEEDDMHLNSAASFESFEEMKEESTMKSSIEAKPMAPQIPVQEKPPSFDELINAQSSSGNWNNNCSALLAKFFSEPMQNDALFQELKALNASNINLLWHTIIALYILEEMFDDRADEWEMISRKAKTWLKQNGVAKPDTYINQLTFSLK